MPCHLVDTIASVFTAIGTVSVAILAIWGDRVKDKFFGPRLTLSLVSQIGDLTQRKNGVRVYYYHLRVTNGKRRIPAQGVQIVVQGFSKRAPSGAFVRHMLVYPLRLNWTPFEPGEVARTVVHESTCDFGFLDETGDDRAFYLATSMRPNNFHGHVGTDKCVRFEVVATGQNVFSLKSQVFEVAWDGRWTNNQEEMKQHLVIREVASL